jgi:transcriptional regulator with XRE-family HTH domain
MVALGQNIKTIRELKNLTQGYMAERLQMSAANYSNIEGGKTNVSITDLRKIAKVLDVSCEQIFSLSPTQIFNNNSPYTCNGGNQTNYINEELVKQLQIKDEQIKQLSTLLEKALNNK